MKYAQYPISSTSRQYFVDFFGSDLTCYEIIHLLNPNYQITCYDVQHFFTFVRQLMEKYANYKDKETQTTKWHTLFKNYYPNTVQYEKVYAVAQIFWIECQSYFPHDDIKLENPNISLITSTITPLPIV